MKIAIVDTYYPAYLESHPIDRSGTYDQQLRSRLDDCFGTFDAYSRGLRAKGWETLDIIANDRELQMIWAREVGHQAAAREGGLEYIAFEQIRRFKPDVVFCQDLSFFGYDWLAQIKRDFVLAGQISCQLPASSRVRMFERLFTSIPCMVEILNAMGPRTTFLPLAFDPIVIARSGPAASREGCVFIGGRGPQWDSSAVDAARSIPGVSVYTNGQLFGTAMYSQFLKSKIVLNRHAFIAKGYSNNLRMFEATGCGAMLLTEESSNIRDYFTERECVTYRTPAEAADLIRYYLEHDDERAAIAAAGQARTLRDHTYTQRMPIVSEVLKPLEHHPA